jgi:hypothetical protein
MKATSFVIDRARWARGGNTDPVQLRDADGMMCCLGFYALACGLGTGTITGIAEYDDIPLESIGAIPEDLATVKSELRDYEDGVETFISTTQVCDSLMTTNDQETLDELARENAITDLFKKIGVEVTFV